jgi:hypothetical protein
MNRPRPLWPWIVATAVALPALYVLSFGPADWIGTWGIELNWWTESATDPLVLFYWPLLWLAVQDHPVATSIGAALIWYATSLAPTA